LTISYFANGLFLVTPGTESGEFGKMMFGMKAKTTGEVVFLLAQFFIGEFSNGSALLADHEAMAAFYGIQATLYKSAAGQHFMS
jgi:hypothetical protein